MILTDSQLEEIENALKINPAKYDYGFGVIINPQDLLDTIKALKEEIKKK